jgi:FAD/FMN-containing dehydrogenase
MSSANTEIISSLAMSLSALRRLYTQMAYEGADPMTPQLATEALTVVDASTPADVRAAVLKAHQNRVPLAVEATGHGAHGSFESGVLLKTTRMASVDVDPVRRVVRVGPGARWSDVIAATSPFGLAPVSGTTPSVGVTGYTLGGGLGWMSRRYGFAADNVTRADVVTADGDLLTVSPDRNEDLFWALRGGGGNFGVVTSLEFRVHPVTEVFGGLTLFPIENAADVIAYYRDSHEQRPDELTANIVVMKTSPVASITGPVLAIRGLYTGDAVDGARALRPLRQVAGTPRYDGFRPMEYAETGTIGGTRPAHLEFFEDLPDDVIAAAVDAVHSGRASAVEVRTWGGAMTRSTGVAGPVGPRDMRFSVMIDGSPEPLIAARATGRSFLNWLHDTSRTHTAYTATDYRRLRDMKTRFDPGNLFCRGHNIAPWTE